MNPDKTEPVPFSHFCMSKSAGGLLAPSGTVANHHFPYVPVRTPGEFYVKEIRRDFLYDEKPHGPGSIVFRSMRFFMSVVPIGFSSQMS